MINVQLKKFFLIVIILLSNGVSMAQEENEMFYYGVDIDLHNVGVDIRVNDIPVYYDDQKGQLVVEAPAPDSIIDGKNTLTIQGFLPFDGIDYVKSYEQGAYVIATLFKQNLALENPPKEKISSISMQFNETSASVITENFISFEEKTSTIEFNENKEVISRIDSKIISPFPRWVWQDGDFIENDESSYSSLLAVYKDIYDALLRKDLTELKKLYKKRAEETAIAYNLKDVEAGYKKLSVGVDMQNEKLELYDFHKNGVELQVLANGKIARIVDDLGAQPILYTEKDGSAVHLYKFMFYKSNNKWELIR